MINFLDILKNNSNTDIQSYYSSLVAGINAGWHYAFIAKVDYVLDYLSTNKKQLILLKKKLEVNNRGELFDVLAEICVFFEHTKESPLFIEEGSEKTPDIKMANSKFIEIKRVRLSNDQIYLLNKLLEKTEEDKNIVVSDGTTALNNKAKEKINKALCQMKNKDGFIYIVYSLDVNMQENPMSFRKIDFETYCYNYFTRKGVRNVILKVVFLNDLLD